MRTLKTDIIFFGFGKLTNLIMKDFLSNNQNVTCITDSYNALNENKSMNLNFMTYKEMIKIKVSAQAAFFTWRNTSTINTRDLKISEWLLSESFSTNKSFFLSSASVYKDSDLALNESENNLNIDLSSNEKYLLEKILANIMQKKNIYHLNLRISNVYGRGLEYGLVNNVISSFKNNTNIEIFRNTKIVRDYVSSIDVIYAINELIKIETKIDNLNVSTGVGTTIDEVLNIFENMGYSLKNFTKIMEPKQIKLSSILDASSLSKLVYWNPIKLQSGIHKCLDMGSIQ
jgi:nucleoside-diphosphate-sugar epimerase